MIWAFFFVNWFRKAADRDHADAQYMLGKAYYSGSGIEKDYTEALELWRKAADQRNGPALNALAIAYYKGAGVEKDDKKAIDWLRKGMPVTEAKALEYLKAETFGR